MKQLIGEKITSFFEICRTKEFEREISLYQGHRDAAAQESRFNSIVYSDSMIRAFAQICGRSDVYRHGIVNLYDDTQRIMLRFDNRK